MAKKLYRSTEAGRVEMSEEEAVEIRAFWAKNAEKEKATQYSKDRQKAYPSWEDQLDQIYHEGIIS